MSKHFISVSFFVAALALVGAGCQQTVKDAKQTGKALKDVGQEAAQVAKDVVDLGKQYGKDVKKAADKTGTAAEKVKEVFGNDSPLLVLKDVSGGAGEATVGRKMINDVFTLAIFATLSDPGNDHHYEAWIVRPSDGDYVNVGTFLKDATGNYYLSHTSGTNRMEYSRVKVTKEPNEGNTEFAEEEILRGDF